MRSIGFSPPAFRQSVEQGIPIGQLAATLTSLADRSGTAAQPIGHLACAPARPLRGGVNEHRAGARGVMPSVGENQRTRFDSDELGAELLKVGQAPGRLQNGPGLPLSLTRHRQNILNKFAASENP